MGSDLINAYPEVDGGSDEGQPAQCPMEGQSPLEGKAAQTHPEPGFGGGEGDEHEESDGDEAGRDGGGPGLGPA